MVDEAHSMEDRHISAGNWFDPLSTGLLHYYLSSVIVVLGMVLGHDFMKSPRQHQGDLLAAFGNWDGKWYREIAEVGYAYDPQVSSNVAFFPAFPLLGRLVSVFTGLAADHALLLVSQCCLAGVFVMMATYAKVHFGPNGERVGPYVLLALGLFPTTFFFRMAYSESLFLLTAILALYGMARNWPLLIVALIVGLSTATRPVGVALLVPLVLQIRARSIKFKGCLLRWAVFVPIACWGILGFMLFQWLAFDEPLAFAKTQSQWRIRPAVSLGDQAYSLLTLEPIWSVYDPVSSCYWRRHETDGNALFSMQVANPVFFVGTIILVVVGWGKGWVNRNEIALAAGLLLIPYVTRSHEMCMGSMGRFAAVVFPVYLVLGHMLSRIPSAMAALILVLSGFWMGIYAAFFAAWYRVF